MSEWSFYPTDKDSPLTEEQLYGCSLPAAQIQEQIDSLAKRSMLSIERGWRGIVIHSKSFVGKIAVGGLEIAVNPKIDGAPFLRLLRYAYGLRNLELIDQAQFAVTDLSFQDLLIYQLFLEASELVNRGLRREYISRHQNLSVPRGRIDVNTIAMQRPGTATLPCITHDRQEDTLLNRILFAGILMATRSAETHWLRIKLNRLRFLFDPKVIPVNLNKELLLGARRAITRLTRIYEPSLELIELIFEGQGASLLDNERKVQMSGFLFDMNRFFQALLSKFLRDYLPQYGVYDEQKIRGMMQYDPAFNPKNRRSPQLRPDFVISKEGQPLAILDAKYRDLWQSELPRDMLYQLAIYALSQEALRSATILYPTTDSNATEARINIRNIANSSTSAQINLRPVNLSTLDKVLTKANHSSKLQLDLGRQLACECAFGIQQSFEA